MNKTNLSAYMAMTVSQLKEEQRMGTAHVYQSTLNRIKDFMEQDSISFEEVTPVWLKAFQEYLLERQLHWNTISTYMNRNALCGMLHSKTDALHMLFVAERCSPWLSAGWRILQWHSTACVSRGSYWQGTPTSGGLILWLLPLPR